MEALVYDRSLDDATRMRSMIAKGYGSLSATELTEWDSMRSKGSWNYTDLNRIGTWINYLIDLIETSGTDVSAITRASTDFTVNSDLRIAYVEQLQSTITALQQLYATIPTLDTMEALVLWNYVQANAIEHNLQILNDAIPSWFIWPTCGDAICGGDYT